MKKIVFATMYWFLSLTWGLLMTLVGLIVTLFAIIFFKGKVHKNGFSYIVEVGDNWGGISLGAVALCGGYTTSCPNEDWFQHTRRHEFGHSIQNIILGPFFPFVVAIPSAIRYHYQNARTKRGLPNREYDAIWFEGQATRWGTSLINKIEK